jgi:molybdenum-dependent DNA-binding transcriptional regulator ModE
MVNRGRKRADDALLHALASGATVEAAARQSGVSERTVYRRLADPAFRRRLQDLRAEMTRRTASSLTAAGTEAVETLRRLLNSSSEPIRVAAARAILQLGAKLREATELEERMAAIEGRLLTAPGRATKGVTAPVAACPDSQPGRARRCELPGTVSAGCRLSLLPS